MSKTAKQALEFEEITSLTKQNKNEGKMSKQQKSQFKEVLRVTDIDKLSLGAIQWYVFKKFVVKHKFGLMTSVAIFEFLYFTSIVNIVWSALHG